jgi:hypothetical protein
MTDGLLLRETMLDPLLSKYSVIMYVTRPAFSDMFCHISHQRFS